MRSEVLFLVGPPDETGARTREPVDLLPLESAGLLRIEPLADPVLPHLVRCAELLTDADAAAVALSGAHGLPLATDDARQRNVACDLYPTIELVSTLDLLHPAVATLGLDEVSARRLVRDVRWGANFLPPKNDPHRQWFASLLAGHGG